jgi:protein-tyrosine phosphatase
MPKKPKNLRDLGGIRTVDGRTVRHGMLYRSSYLYKLSEADAELLQDSIGLSTVVDLTTPPHPAEKKDTLPEDVKYIHLPPLDDKQNPSVNRKNRLGILKGIMAKEGGAKKHLSDIYRVMITQEASLDAFRQLISLLTEEENSAVLWHCTQGKDRTGIATAVVLMSLGVDRDEIMRDYMKTNRSCFFKNLMIFIGVSLVTFSIHTARSLDLLLSARPFFLKAAFDEIDSVYGGTEAFLKNGIGLTDSDISELRSIYLV